MNPLAPDVPPTSIDPWSTDLADERVTKVNICTSKTFNLYLSSALPKVLSGSSMCSIAAVRAYPIRLPCWSPGVAVYVSLNSIT